ncbi:CRISPR system precrRNA processing endoribonuclease RAMP protein Cas6 [Nocardiopsis protaetiae]|uniref:CRISPR system precrRNA processing endoribonuclease RAMP protein Cas6 n=2 Tax=Nocardiopsis protaetiae TaxID=3382270 RepID=UPI00387B74DD
MPTQWTLTLTPPPPDPVDPRHLHALACQLLETPTAEHTAATKPFTAAATGAHLVASWLGGPAEPDLGAKLADPLRLGAQPVRLSPADHRSVSYPRLLDLPPTAKAAVEFVSPAYVSRNGRQLPLSDPELLLAGLARRWAAFSPLPLPEQEVDQVLGAVFLTRHRIATRTVGQGPHRRTGFVGRAAFGLPARATPAQRQVFTALWAFAEFAGVGAQTTHGLGHVRVHLHERPADPERARPGPGGVREATARPTTTTPTGQSRNLAQNEGA